MFNKSIQSKIARASMFTKNDVESVEEYNAIFTACSTHPWVLIAAGQMLFFLKDKKLKMVELYAQEVELLKVDTGVFSLK